MINDTGFKLATATQQAFAPVRICIVDHQELVREGLASMLSSEPGMHVVTCCNSTAEWDGAQVDVIIFVCDSDVEPAFTLMAELKNRDYCGRVLILAGAVSDDDAFRLACSGVAGIVLKTASRDVLVQAIGKAATGEMLFEPRLMRTFLRKVASIAAPRPVELFTPRERAVLHHVLDGLSNKEIAAQMALRESSVKSVIQRLFDKTDVRSRGQLVRVALERYRAAL